MTARNVDVASIGEADVDAAIAACDGDARRAVAELLADVATLRGELDFAGLAMSFGFSRGWFARNRKPAE